MFAFRRDILEEHADEAAFLVRQRERAFDSRLRNLGSLAELDERLLAHLDGLVLAEAKGWEVVEPGLEEKEPGPAMVAAFVALAVEFADVSDALEAALQKPICATGLHLGLRLARGGKVEARLRRLSKSDSLLTRAFALEAISFRGADVPPDQTEALLRSGEPETVRLGLMIAGRERQQRLAPFVERALADSDPELARSAFLAALYLGLPVAHDAGRQFAGRDDRLGTDALRFLPLAGGADVHDVLLRALGAKESARLACLGLGRCGNPAALETLVSAMEKPETARAAGHSLHTLLGVDLEVEKLAFPPGEAPSPADDLSLEADEDLPWPDPERIRSWVQARPPQEKNGVRLRVGKPFVFGEVLVEARTGTLPDREAAILECSLRLPGVRPLESRSWAKDQELRMQTFTEEVARASAGHRAGTWPTLSASASRRA